MEQTYMIFRINCWLPGIDQLGSGHAIHIFGSAPNERAPVMNNKIGPSCFCDDMMSDGKFIIYVKRRNLT
ncbi:hypothetical protein C0Q44_14055 [Paenibacillus sp. PCH8]|nr:hypothetical protein C0Q44_14055 [Paenibacillus sp. PCH8]